MPGPQLALDNRIVRLSHREHGSQYGIVYKFAGITRTKRLTGCYPTTDKFENEPTEMKVKILEARFNAIQELLIEGPQLPGRCPFKTATGAMDAFVKECNRDHHGGSFKEFFGDMRLVEVPEKRKQFVEWLIQKYGYNQATVCKKVFAASALFEWLRRKEYWLRDNPFRRLLVGIRFDEQADYKSIIEPEEMERLRKAMEDEKFKELRIATTIMYYCGLRPSEAIRLTWDNFDTRRLTLTYIRSKRHNKSPDRRTIPIHAKLVDFLKEEGRTEGQLVRVDRRALADQMSRARYNAKVSGVTLKTFRKDFATRARYARASSDDVNLYQGREGSILEKHYTTDKLFIIFQCREWIERLFSEKQLALAYSSEWRNRELTEEARGSNSEG